MCCGIMVEIYLSHEHLKNIVDSFRHHRMMIQALIPHLKKLMEKNEKNKRKKHYSEFQ